MNNLKNIIASIEAKLNEVKLPQTTQKELLKKLLEISDEISNNQILED